MTAFIILHYMAVDCTLACIKNVRELSGSKHIVVVDNASPDGSGTILRDSFAGSSDVTVLLNGCNEGYARGNNQGIEYVVERLDAEFVVVLNNDVEVLQRDFCERISASYAEHPFDVLGPDIISAFSGIHQSPKQLETITLEVVRAKMRYLRRNLNPVLLYLSSGEKSCTSIYKKCLRRRREKAGIDGSVEYEGVVLHGACVIFSARWLRGHKRPFCDETYMYYEMEILDYLGKREGYVSRYDPALQVRHLQNVSTQVCYKSMIKRSRFVIYNLLESCGTAESLILSDLQEKQRLHNSTLHSVDSTVVTF